MVNMSETASQVRMQLMGVRMCRRVSTVMLMRFMGMPKMQTSRLR